jgi:hypothetical protein
MSAQERSPVLLALFLGTLQVQHTYGLGYIPYIYTQVDTFLVDPASPCLGAA